MSSNHVHSAEYSQEIKASNYCNVCAVYLVIASDKVFSTARAIELRIKWNGLDWSIEVDCLIVVHWIQAINYNLSKANHVYDNGQKVAFLQLTTLNRTSLF